MLEGRISPGSLQLLRMAENVMEVEEGTHNQAFFGSGSESDVSDSLLLGASQWDGYVPETAHNISEVQVRNFRF